MIDIVERLRGSTHQIDHDAADEIERLREGLKIASAAVEILEREVAAQRSAANEHRNAAMEADLRTQAAVRGEKKALALVQRLSANALPLLGALRDDVGGGLPDVDAWIDAAAAVLRDLTPNVKVRGPTAALSPEAPSRLPGSAAAGHEAP